MFREQFTDSPLRNFSKSSLVSMNSSSNWKATIENNTVIPKTVEKWKEVWQLESTSPHHSPYFSHCVHPVEESNSVPVAEWAEFQLLVELWEPKQELGTAFLCTTKGTGICGTGQVRHSRSPNLHLDCEGVKDLGFPLLQVPSWSLLDLLLCCCTTIILRADRKAPGWSDRKVLTDPLLHLCSSK